MCVCTVHAIAEIDGRTGIVMEHVTGETLQATLGRGPVAPQTALDIASEIAEAMEISVEAVESLTARGKRTLAGILSGRREELGYGSD